MIIYKDSLENIGPQNLHGFFVGWPKPPSPETHYNILLNSRYVILAVDDESENVIGFVNAVSDGHMCAYIPLLEVLPSYGGRGIGSELMRRLMKKLDGLYMIDLVCNRDLIPFYKRFNMKSVSEMKIDAMIIRDFKHQSGR